MTRTVESPPRPALGSGPTGLSPTSRPRGSARNSPNSASACGATDSRYALGLHERIGWGEALRIGLARYNTMAEMDKFQRDLAQLVTT